MKGNSHESYKVKHSIRGKWWREYFKEVISLTTTYVLGLKQPWALLWTERVGSWSTEWEWYTHNVLSKAKPWSQCRMSWMLSVFPRYLQMSLLTCWGPSVCILIHIAILQWIMNLHRHKMHIQSHLQQTCLLFVVKCSRSHHQNF